MPEQTQGILMDVYWLQQTDADVPAADDWLSEWEAIFLRRLRFTKRRWDWRLGRWTAKQAVALFLNMPTQRETLVSIEIRPAASGVPEVFFADQPAPITISLSHRDGAAVCAVAPERAALGCDLEVIEPRSDAFVADYFTPEEQTFVAQASAADRPRLLALLWSAKESTLKALRTGLRLDTRCVVVKPVDTLQRWGEPAACSSGIWYPLQVSHNQEEIFHGWWRQTGNLLQTLVATPRPSPPISLAPHDLSSPTEMPRYSADLHARTSAIVGAGNRT